MDEGKVEVSDPFFHFWSGELIFDLLKVWEFWYSGLERAVGRLFVGPQCGPYFYEIAGGGEHDAIDGGFDQEAGRLPAQHLVDRDRYCGVEEEVGVEGVGHGTVDAAAAAERLHQLALVDLPADGFDLGIGVLIAVRGDTGAVAQADAALDRVVPVEAVVLRCCGNGAFTGERRR